MINLDLTFITNEKDKSLLERFKILIKDCEYFDALVGYFFISGFHRLYPSLKKTDRTTYELLEKARQQKLPLHTHAKTKKQMPDRILEEFEVSEDTKSIEQGVHKFVEWIKSGPREVILSEYLTVN